MPLKIVSLKEYWVNKTEVDLKLTAEQMHIEVLKICYTLMFLCVIKKLSTKVPEPKAFRLVCDISENV